MQQKIPYDTMKIWQGQIKNKNKENGDRKNGPAQKHF